MGVIHDGVLVESEANGVWIVGGLGNPALEAKVQLRDTASEALPL